MNVARAAAIALLACGLRAQPQVYFDREGMRLAAATVTARGGGRFALDLTMADDNGDGSLPTSYRRWWACGVRGLDPAGSTLEVAVGRAGYSDVILPVWSLSRDGVAFSEWARMPSSATPSYSASTHRFTVAVPPGMVELRMAKYFPYSVAQKDQLLARAAVRGDIATVQALGSSAQGRAVHLLELTDRRVPALRKRRVWVHAGIHPAENTSYFVVEGLVDALLEPTPLARLLLAHVAFDVVPMANPDGVALGNYRTNARSANLEEEWAAPYASPEPEVMALQRAIEQRMGTPQAPGAAPIDLLFNLHSSHGLTWPFHYEHVANPSFDLQSNRTGVIPEVNARERAWIAAFRTASAFVAAGTTQSSTAGAPRRPFVESMMHDRWSVDPLWRGVRTPVMAITFEGTYGPAPGAAWNDPDDYRRVGREMVTAVAAMLGLVPGGAAVADGTACGVDLAATVLAAGVACDLRLRAAGPGFGAFVFGTQAWLVPLPPGTCPLRTDPALAVPVGLDAIGGAGLRVPVPPGAWALRAQAVAVLPAMAPATSVAYDLAFVR